MSIVLGILTFILILVSLFLILVVLAQRAKSDGGMGSALGGGMAESAFGGETGNVLTKATINASIAFFVLSFLLYLGNVYQRSHGSAAAGALPSIPVPVTSPMAPLSTTPQPGLPAPAVSTPVQPAPTAATTASAPAPKNP
ncbi:MAG TPA: preprotein translocase subunit SecG [Opitutaceae bacterium]|nr:preprotein translocase subunit SecG [Opitutaceae bacterium]